MPTYQSIASQTGRLNESDGIFVVDTNESDPNNEGEHDDDDDIPTNKLLSPLEAAIHLVKGNLGPGCLNLPHAFGVAGWGLGSGLFFIVALQGIYSMWLLVQCKAMLQRQNELSGSERKVHTFMEVAQTALGPSGGRVVELFLFILQGGVCCVFLSLLSTNLVAALPKLSSTTAVIIVTILLSFMVLLRFLKDLVWLSASANAIMIMAILTASMAGFLHWMSHSDDSYEPPPVVSNRPLYAAVTFTSDMFFSFEGIGLVLPIENSYVGTGATQQAISFDTLLVMSMTITAGLFLLVGLPAVFGFPDIQSGSVTAYLAERYPDHLWFAFINAMVMVAVALTFPLQLQPAVQVLDQWIDEDGCCGGAQNPDGEIEIERVYMNRRDVVPDEAQSGESVSQIARRRSGQTLTCGATKYTWLFRRLAIVLVCASIVIVVNDLGVLMSLFGAVGQTGLAAMPCAIHLALQKQGIAPRNGLLTGVNVMTVLFCVVVMITGCSQAIREILEE